jgi:hypothetical protein
MSDNRRMSRFRLRACSRNVPFSDPAQPSNGLQGNISPDHIGWRRWDSNPRPPACKYARAGRWRTMTNGCGRSGAQTGQWRTSANGCGRYRIVTASRHRERVPAWLCPELGRPLVSYEGRMGAVVAGLGVAFPPPTGAHAGCRHRDEARVSTLAVSSGAPQRSVRCARPIPGPRHRRLSTVDTSEGRIRSVARSRKSAASARFCLNVSARRGAPRTSTSQSPASSGMSAMWR